MWIVFGVLAVASAAGNVALAVAGKDGKWPRFASLAFTALTLCAFYQQNSNWVEKEDWSALMDVVPTMSRMLWTLTGGSIAVNGVSLFIRTK